MTTTMTLPSLKEAPADANDRKCETCGCSFNDPCTVTAAPERAWNQPGQTCWWVDDRLCSACTDRIDPRLKWQHGGQRDAHEPLPWTHKAVFVWVAFAILAGLANLIGLL